MYPRQLWILFVLFLAGPAIAENAPDPCAGKTGKKLTECLGENNATGSQHGAVGATTMHALDADDEPSQPPPPPPPQPPPPPPPPNLQK
jgi:hypothetical protein